MRYLPHGLAFLFTIICCHFGFAKSVVKEKKILSPATLWQEMKKTDPTFIPPEEPLVRGEKNFYHEQRVLGENLVKKYGKAKLFYEKLSDETFKSEEIQKFDGRGLEAITKLVQSPSLKCGYNPDEEMLGQVGNSIRGMSDLMRHLQGDVLAAVKSGQKKTFLLRHQQMLGFFKKNLDCSYAIIQLLILQSGLKNYFQMIAEPAFPPEYRPLISKENEQFLQWFSQTVTLEKLRSFYPREAFTFITVLEPYGRWNKIPSGDPLSGESNDKKEADILTLLTYASIELEKDYERIKKNPDAELSLQDLMSLIYFPSEQSHSYQEDMPLFIQTVRAIQKEPARVDKEGGLFALRETVAQQFYRDLGLEEFGLKKSQDLFQSKALTKVILKVMEDPTLRYRLRMKFKESKFAMRYRIYGLMSQLSAVSMQGVEQKFILKREEFLKIAQNL